MDMISYIICSVFVGATVIYWYFNYKFSYWVKRGVACIEPQIPYGNIREMGRKYHSSELLKQYYDELKSTLPFSGIFFFTQPVALITDLDLIKNILVRDFNHFPDRGLYVNEKDDPLSAHLLYLDGDRWKTLRSKLTPTFTSGKMRNLFPIILKVGDEFYKTLIETTKNTPNGFDIKYILSRYSIDVIGTCAFGIETNTLKDPDTHFYKMSTKFFDVPITTIQRMFMVMFPNFARFLHMKTVRDDVGEFFTDVVKQTINYREKYDIKRNDFMNLLIQLKENGKLKDSANTIDSLNINEITAQVMLFFLAGFETSSTTMSCCLYELALNRTIQDRTREEIKETLGKYNGELTYEAMLELKYLDQVLNETIRKYPAGGNIMRKAVKDYHVPNTDKIIEKGIPIWIPAYAIHHDPKIYPDPEVFDPDRFSVDQQKLRHSCAFLGFSEGPRNCIGARFGMMQTRIGLVTIIKNFYLTTCPKTQTPLEFKPSSMVLSLKNGLFLKFNPIEFD